MSYRYTQDLSLSYTRLEGYDMFADQTQYYANFFLPSEVTNLYNYEYQRQANFQQDYKEDPYFGVFSMTLLQGSKVTDTIWFRTSFFDFIASFGALFMTFYQILQFLVNNYEEFIKDKSMMKLLYGELP